MLSILIVIIIIIGCYNPMGQAIPVANNPVSEVKLTHVIFGGDD